MSALSSNERTNERSRIQNKHRDWLTDRHCIFSASASRDSTCTGSLPGARIQSRCCRDWWLRRCINVGSRHGNALCQIHRQASRVIRCIRSVVHFEALPRRSSKNWPGVYSSRMQGGCTQWRIIITIPSRASWRQISIRLIDDIASKRSWAYYLCWFGRWLEKGSGLRDAFLHARCLPRPVRRFGQIPRSAAIPRGHDLIATGIASGVSRGEQVWSEPFKRGNTVKRKPE